MKNKISEIDHEKLSQEIKDLAKKNIKDIWNDKLTLKQRTKNGLTGISIHSLFAITWIIRNYRWFTEFLRIKLGIKIKWIIITIISAWTLAGILRNSSSL